MTAFREYGRPGVATDFSSLLNVGQEGVRCRVRKVQMRSATMDSLDAELGCLLKKQDEHDWRCSGTFFVKGLMNCTLDRSCWDENSDLEEESGISVSCGDGQMVDYRARVRSGFVDKAVHWDGRLGDIDAAFYNMEDIQKSKCLE